MRKFKNCVYLLFIFSIFIVSCEKDKVEELPNAQAYITKMSIESIPITRSSEYANAQEANRVKFYEFMSDTNYSYDFITYSENEFGVDMDQDGIVDIKMTQKDGLVTAIMDKYICTSKIIKTEDNGKINFSIENVEDDQITRFARPCLEEYSHMSWFDCVSNLAGNRDITLGLGLGLASCFYNWTFCGVAAAASVICLDSRMRWRVVDHN